MRTPGTRTPGTRTLLTYATTLSAVTATAVVGGLATDPDDRWYRDLVKPSWQPPPAAYGIVWTPLFLALAVAGARTYGRLEPGPERQQFVAAFVINLKLNVGWSWLFFGAHRPKLALAEILLLEASVLDLARRAKQVDPTSHKLLVPYAAWVVFATALNAELVRLNP